MAHKFDQIGPAERVAARQDEGWWNVEARNIVDQPVGLRAIQATAVRGVILHPYPLWVRVDSEQTAEFQIKGGIGFVPMSFAGLTEYKGYELLEGRNGKLVRLTQQRDQMIGDLKNQVATLVTQTATRVLGAELQSNHDKLIEESLANLGRQN